MSPPFILIAFIPYFLFCILFICHCFGNIGVVLKRTLRGIRIKKSRKWISSKNPFLFNFTTDTFVSYKLLKCVDLSFWTNQNVIKFFYILSTPHTDRLVVILHQWEYKVPTFAHKFLCCIVVLIAAMWSNTEALVTLHDWMKTYIACTSFYSVLSVWCQPQPVTCPPIFLNHAHAHSTPVTCPPNKTLGVWKAPSDPLTTQ